MGRGASPCRLRPVRLRHRRTWQQPERLSQLPSSRSWSWRCQPAWTSRSWTWKQPWPADSTERRWQGWSAPSTRGLRPVKSLRSLCLQNACFCSLRSHFPCWLRGLRGCRCTGVSGLGEESGCRKYSGNRGAGSQRILRRFLARGILEIDVANIDNPGQAAQAAEEVEQVEIGAVGLDFERHVVVVFAGDHGLRGQTANLHVRSGRRTL